MKAEPVNCCWFVDLPSLGELPRDVQDFQSMCTLAYKGSMVNKVTFSCQDFLWPFSCTQRVSQVVYPHLATSFIFQYKSHSRHSITQSCLQVNKFALSMSVWQSLICSCLPLLCRIHTEGIWDVVAQIARGRQERLLWRWWYLKTRD